jgi:hypothetical protein
MAGLSSSIDPHDSSGSSLVSYEALPYSSLINLREIQVLDMNFSDYMASKFELEMRQMTIKDPSEKTIEAEWQVKGGTLFAYTAFSHTWGVVTKNHLIKINGSKP